ncbi:MAG: pyridoxamine 5'-phosphate oxidase family protein [Burkholderiales bacterium]|nr:pyridoxamine 5'-phosphate oxidase family protein [Burkholderiales bacterium]
MLNEQCANFIQRYTSMSVAARDAHNRPVVGRALGCRVSADRRKLTVFLSGSREALALECLRENGAIALTVTRPTTNETLQFKGTVRDILTPSDADRAEIAAYRQSFVEELATMGYEPGFSDAVLAGSEDSMAVVFEPSAIYDQTPGPKAGAKLETRP